MFFVHHLPLLFICFRCSTCTSLARPHAHVVTLLVHRVLVLQDMFSAELIAIQSVLLTDSVGVATEQALWWWSGFA